MFLAEEERYDVDKHEKIKGLHRNICLSTAQLPFRESHWAVRIQDGMRVASMIWVVCHHCMTQAVGIATNPVVFFDWLKLQIMQVC